MGTDIRQLVRLIEQVGKLKKVPRAGWLRVGVRRPHQSKHPESVADHSFNLAVMAKILTPCLPHLNADRCIRLCLIHDLVESITGDITPHDGITPEEKRRRESKAAEKLSRSWPDNSFQSLWTEYQRQETPEAAFVHQLDALEMVFQAREYARQSISPKKLQQFWNSAAERITIPLLKETLEYLRTHPPQGTPRPAQQRAR